MKRRGIFPLIKFPVMLAYLFEQDPAMLFIMDIDSHISVCPVLESEFKVRILEGNSLQGMTPSLSTLYNLTIILPVHPATSRWPGVHPPRQSG